MKLMAPFGVPLKFNWSILILLGLLAYQGGIVLGSLCFTLLVISTLFHEYSHVWMGLKLGYRPKMVIFFALGAAALFENMPTDPKQELKISLAGPIGSLVLALICAPFALLFHNFIFYYLLAINVLLGLFNMLPLYPADGGRVLYCILAKFMSRIKAVKIALFVSYVLCCVGMVFCVIFKMWFMMIVFAFLCVFANVQQKQLIARLNLENY